MVPPRLVGGEAAVVKPGRAPVKTTTVRPENAVNWTLPYFGLFSADDIKRAGSVMGPVIKKAIAAYNANRLRLAYKIWRAAESSSKNESSWLALGGFFNAGERQAGMDAVIRASLITPHSSANLSYLAKAYYEQQQMALAAKSLVRAERLDPKDPTPHLYRAMMMHTIEELYEARRLNDNRAVLSSNVAVIYNELGFDFRAGRRRPLLLKTAL